MTSPRPDGSSSSPELTRVILVLDVVESVRLMEGDEHGFIRRWQRFVRDARDHVLPAFGGRIHKSIGDGLMLEFADARDAVGAAFELLRISGASNDGRRAEEQMRLRIAAHVARFVADEYDIYGCGVNLTSRLLGVARPGEVCITAALRDLLGPDMLAQMEDAGTHQLRHLREPVQVFRVRCAPPQEHPQSVWPAATA
jgi:class 3 adenylate cyclase